MSGGATAGFEASRRRLAKWAVAHPVLWDDRDRNARTYAVSGWPSAYLIGPDGTVFWQGNPAALRGDATAERVFRAALEAQLLRTGAADLNRR